jgi:DNA/RNA-binding domain of Phe-tRNA-synthetase-like protein
MPAVKNKEKILRLVDEVPEEELGKVVSLMEKLKKPVEKKIPKKYKAIYDAMGAFKNSMPSSEEFLKRKQEDKLLDR